MNRSPRPTVAVIGAGVAGLVAARDLARGGADVVVLDEQSAPGGQYYRRRHGTILREHGDVRPRGTSLIAEVRAAGVDIRSGTTVWGVDDDGRTLLTASNTGTGTDTLNTDAVVVATGAHERSIPFRGWLLPGVMTPGAALHLAKIDRVAPGRRMVVAGSGPFLLPVAAALVEVGCRVEAVFEHAHPLRPGLRGASAIAHPEKLRELAHYMTVLRRARVPYRQGWHVAAATPSDEGQVDTVRITDGRRTEALSIDALAVGFGFRPNTELLSVMGVSMTLDHLTHDNIPVCDDHGRTDRPRIYTAGETRGIAGAAAAAVRGGLAAMAVGQDLGLRVVSRSTRRRLLRRSAEHSRFASTLQRLYPVPRDLVVDVEDDVTVCRCEGVSAGSIREAAATGWNDLNASKGSTRAGMGPCQGRQCAFAVAYLVEAGTGTRPQPPFSARTPVKPVRVRDLLAQATAVPAPPGGSR